MKASEIDKLYASAAAKFSEFLYTCWTGSCSRDVSLPTITIQLYRSPAEVVKGVPFLSRTMDVPAHTLCVVAEAAAEAAGMFSRQEGYHLEMEARLDKEKIGPRPKTAAELHDPREHERNAELSP